jgi:predicted dithiol-disulfide oxidoreductase (DUF899 family)
MTLAEMETTEVVSRAEWLVARKEFQMEELPGLSIFCKNEDGEVFQTYSTYARGLDLLIETYNFLDLVPKGRDEKPDSTMDWVQRHDEYED